MKYIIQTTLKFDKWLKSVKDKTVKTRLTQRIDNMSLGYFGDHKSINDSISELRFFFGSGYRIYYTIQHDLIILLLCGGDKSFQNKDIEKAKQLLNELEE